MKKLLIGLTLLLGVSVVGASASFGYVLKNEVNTYKIEEEVLLKKESLKKVYIDSEVPTRLCVTEGQPRIEVKGSGIGVFVNKPNYNVEVRAEGDTSYINIDRDKMGHVGMYFDNEEEVVIYLAKQDMEQLSLSAYTSYYRNKEMLQLGEINIKNVMIDTRYSNVNLSGNFETIEVNQSGGFVKVDSKSPVRFVGDGPVSLDLRGQFESIDLYNHSGSVRVDSKVPTQVQILGNSYYGQGQEMVLKGAYKNIDVNVGGGEVILDLTTAPERVNVLGEVGRVQIGLPKDIKGYSVVKRNPHAEGDYYDEKRSTIYSEFSSSQSQFREGAEMAVYGDGSTQIIVEGYGSEIRILQER
ncbi:MAG: DUF4097 family beta strand repeat-containing protein [Cellulosilyticaceae bacterium]